MSTTIFEARACRRGGHLRLFALSRIADHNVRHVTPTVGPARTFKTRQQGADPRDRRYCHRHGQIILNLGRVMQLWRKNRRLSVKWTGPVYYPSRT
jgi:hypothetical protein